jgi:hypothetical protein
MAEKGEVRDFIAEEGQQFRKKADAVKLAAMPLT